MKKLIIAITLITIALFLTGCTSSNQSQVQSSSSYTMEEVSSHDTAGDCWMIISSKVYDVTDYVSIHPGGENILQGCGKDSTVLFENQGHSLNAKSLKENYYVGDLVE